MNASGSATRENQRVIESIQGRINLLNNDWQKLWSNTLDSDVIKFFIDAADAAVRLIDKLGAIPTILSLIAGGIAVIKGKGIVEKFSLLTEAVTTFANATSTFGKKQSFSLLFGGLSGKIDAGNLEQYNSTLSQLHRLLQEGERGNYTNAGLIRQLKNAALASDQFTDAQKNTIRTITHSADAELALSQAVEAGRLAKLRDMAVTIARNAVLFAGVAIVAHAITNTIRLIKEEAKARKEAKQQASEQAQERINEYNEMQNALQRYHDAFKETNANESDQEAATKAVVDALGDKANRLKELEKGTAAYNRELEKLIANEEKQVQVSLEQRRRDAETIKYNLDQSVKDNRRTFANAGLSSWLHRPTEGIEFAQRNNLDSFDISTAEGQINYYHKLVAVRDELNQKKAEGHKLSLQEQTDYDIANKFIEEQKDVINDNTSALVQYYIQSHNAIPTTVKEFNELKDTILETYHVTEDSRDAFESIIDDIFPYLAQRSDMVNDTLDLIKSKMRQFNIDTDGVMTGAQFDAVAESHRRFIESLSEDDLEKYNQILSDESYELNKIIIDTIELQAEIEKYNQFKKAQTEVEEGFIAVLKKEEEAIDKYQERIGTLSSMLSDMFDGSVKSSDYLDYLQEVAKMIDEIDDDSLKTSLEKQFNNLEFGNIEQLASIAEDAGRISAQHYVNSFEKMNNITLPETLKATWAEAIRLEGKLVGVTNGINNLASAYNTLQGAIDQYNEDGVMTISTITSLLQLEPQYLALLSDENGLLTLNEEGLIAIAQQRIKDAQAVNEENAALEINAIVQGAVARAADNARQAVNRQAKHNAILAQSFGVISGSAVNAAQAISVYQRALNGADDASSKGLLTNEEQQRIDDIRSQTSRVNNLLQQMYDGITSGGKDTRDKIMGYSSKAADDAAKNAEDAAAKIKSAIDELLAKWKQAVDDGTITYKTYLEKMKQITDRYYKEGKLSAEDYADYQHQYLEGQVEMWKQVESAVQHYLDGQKEAIQDQIDALNKQKEAFEDNIEAIEEYYDTLLKPLNKDKENLEANKEALEEERDAYNKIIESIEKRYNKEIEANEKIIKGHEKNIKAIEKEMKPYQEQIELYERQIKALEKDIKPYEKQIKALEKQISIYEKQIDLLEEQKEPYEEQIKAIEKVQKENEKAIKILEKQKKPFEDQIKILENQRKELEEANKAREDALRLQKAQYELERAQNQRVNNVYEGGQFIYKADDAAIKSAREELDNIVFDAQVKAIDDAIEVLQGSIDSLQVRIEKIEEHNEILNEQIEGLNEKIEALDEQIDALNKQIEPLNKQIDSLNEHIDSINEEIDILNEKIEDLNDLLQPLEDQINDINKLIDELKEKNEELQEQQEAETESLRNTVEAIEEVVASYEDQIKVIDKRIDAIEKQRDVEIEAIEEQIKALDKETETLQKQIEKIDEYAKQWSKVVEQWERIKEEKLLSEIFGEGWQEKLDSLDPTVLQNFASAYMVACENLAASNKDLKDTIKDISDQAKATKADLDNMYEASKKANEEAKKQVPMVYSTSYTKVNDLRGSLPITKQSSRKSMWNAYLYNYNKGGRVLLPTAANGRRVTTADLLTQLANKVGEDTMVAAKVGEGIFTKRQTDDLEEFIKLTPALIESTKGLEKYAQLVSMLDLSGTVREISDSAAKTQAQIETAVSNISDNMKRLQNVAPVERSVALSIGDIHIAHADDANGLAKQIKANFPNAMLQLLST